MTTATASLPNIDRRWWKEAVVYQIYPRSFADSNGDGIGDLNGITDHLDHIADLGVDVIWLSPHFDSPNADNGYDIRDYRKVMREFGTMEDFDRMLAAIKAKGMRLIIDLVVNHTSDEHAWFVESRASRDNAKRDYYIWRPGEAGVPNNFPAFFGGSAWQKDDATGDYYLHYFAVKQPDLNWDNQDVRADVYDLMRFWLDKGVDGFRMDVIPFISKDQSFPDLAADRLTHPQDVYANGPHIHDYLQEMNREVLSKYDVMTVGEAFGISPEQTPAFVSQARRELDMIFHFDIVRIDRDGWKKVGWTIPQLKAIYRELDHSVGGDGWNATFLGNHDNPRAVSHFGDDGENRVASAKALAVMMFLQRGTPFIYQGEEFGMTNLEFADLKQFDDVEVRGLVKDFVDTGKVSADELLRHMNQVSRDHSRTPIQWSDAPLGGFTTAGKAWFAPNPNFATINAAADKASPDSIYGFYRRLIALRAGEDALLYGAYADLDPAHGQVFAFSRTLGDKRFVVIINLAGDAIDYALPGGTAGLEPVLGNLADATPPADGRLALRPWEAVVFSAPSA